MIIGTSGSIVVCISPLTGIMMEQQSKYKPKGIDVEYICEDIDSVTRKHITKGEVQLVFVSPESIINNALYRNMLLSCPYREKLVASAIDEAHCVKTWGEEFRVAFAQIGEIRSLIPPEVNIISLTSTATSATYEVVKRKLCLKNPTLVAVTPNRDNISYRVHSKICSHLHYVMK